MTSHHQSGVLNAVADRGRELDVAATKIQARYRGHKLRRTKKQEYQAASKVQVGMGGCACACAFLPLSLLPHSKKNKKKTGDNARHNQHAESNQYTLSFARPTRGTVTSAVVVLASFHRLLSQTSRVSPSLFDVSLVFSCLRPLTRKTPSLPSLLHTPTSRRSTNF